MATSTAVDLSAVARVLGIKTTYVNKLGSNVTVLPQRVALVGQGNTAETYSTTKQQMFSADEVANAYGFGSPLHLAALQLVPINGDGLGSIPMTVYPLDDAGSGSAASGSVTPTGVMTKQATFYALVSEVKSVEFTLASGATVADACAALKTAIDGVLAMPITTTDNSTDVAAVAKWKGASGNDIHIEIVGDTTGGITWAVTQPNSGATNPDVDDALSQVGNVWETMFVNCLELADTDTLDKYSTFGEGRWGASVHKPMVAFSGQTPADVAAGIAITDGRKTDITNASIAVMGGNDLPCVIAARAVARIAKVAQNDPASDYGSQDLTGLTPGTDGVQLDHPKAQAMVLGGSGTTIARDGVVYQSDTVTMYHPTGNVLPEYRFVCDIVKLQNVLFNFQLIFETKEWDGAPLIPDDEETLSKTAKKPKMAKQAIANMVDGLADMAILVDRKATKAGIEANINESNPKRLDMSCPAKVCGNTNIKSIDLNWGKYFGTAA